MALAALGETTSDKSITRTEIEVRLGKDKVTGEMIKSGVNRVGNWIWMLCNMAFENGVMLEG